MTSTSKSSFFAQLWEYMKPESSHNYKIYYMEVRYEVSTAEGKMLDSIIA
jgi:hypothetical protein